jgi:sporadic carbohydrate cluster protein (TIGR04323 family)
MPNLKGYIFSRPFYGERVPQNVQNLVLRDYCRKKKFHYLLSATEYKTENSYLILHELLKKINSYDGIIFYSLLQLPLNKSERNQIYLFMLKRKKFLHFALENINIEKKLDVQNVEKIISIKTHEIQNINNHLYLSRKEKYYVQAHHNRTKRNYLERMANKKIQCMKIAKKYDKNYWDGDRKFGYGGYKYIKNYWKSTALDLIKDYKLNDNSKLLDIGAGKGFLLCEIKKILPKIKIIGLDISRYAIINAHPKIRKSLKYYDVSKKMSFKNNEFDLVISIATLHNLDHRGLEVAISEIERIGKKKYIMVESFRNEDELFNLQCWALTCQSFLSKRDWLWFFDNVGYSGDYEFIYFKN